MKKRYMFLIMMLMCTEQVYGATYKYDDLNRVVKIIYDSGVVITYEYDSAGNITKVTNHNPEEDNSGGGNGGTGGGNTGGGNGGTGGGNTGGGNGGAGGGNTGSGNGGTGGGNTGSGNGGAGGGNTGSGNGGAGGGNTGSGNGDTELDNSDGDNSGTGEITPEIGEETNKERKKLVLTLNSKVGYLDGEEISLTGSMFISKQNRLMLPIRQISYAINIPNNKILWDAKNKIVTINGDRTVIVQINSPYMTVDGNKVELNERAQIKEGRAYLPIADICRAFELGYNWDNIKKEITIY